MLERFFQFISSIDVTTLLWASVVFVVGFVLWSLGVLFLASRIANVRLGRCKELIRNLGRVEAMSLATAEMAHEQNGWFRHLEQLIYLASLSGIVATVIGFASFNQQTGESLRQRMGLIAIGPLLVFSTVLIQNRCATLLDRKREQARDASLKRPANFFNTSADQIDSLNDKIVNAAMQFEACTNTLMRAADAMNQQLEAISVAETNLNQLVGNINKAVASHEQILKTVNGAIDASVKQLAEASRKTATALGEQVQATIQTGVQQTNQVLAAGVKQTQEAAAATMADLKTRINVIVEESHRGISEAADARARALDEATKQNLQHFSSVTQSTCDSFQQANSRLEFELKAVLQKWASMPEELNQAAEKRGRELDEVAQQNLQQLSGVAKSTCESFQHTSVRLERELQTALQKWMAMPERLEEIVDRHNVVATELPKYVQEALKKYADEMSQYDRRIVEPVTRQLERLMGSLRTAFDQEIVKGLDKYVRELTAHDQRLLERVSATEPVHNGQSPKIGWWEFFGRFVPWRNRESRDQDKMNK